MFSHTEEWLCWLFFFLVVQLAESYITDQRLNPCPMQWKQSPHHWTGGEFPPLLIFCASSSESAPFLLNACHVTFMHDCVCFCGIFICIYHKQVTSLIIYYRHMFYFPLDLVLFDKNYSSIGAFLVVQMVKNLPAMQEVWVWSLGWEDSLKKGMAAGTSIFAWRIPWTEEPGGL